MSVLHGALNGRDYIAWAMESDPDAVARMVAAHRLECGIVRRAQNEGEPPRFFVLVDWSEAREEVGII